VAVTPPHNEQLLMGAQLAHVVVVLHRSGPVLPLPQLCRELCLFNGDCLAVLLAAGEAAGLTQACQAGAGGEAAARLQLPLLRSMDAGARKSASEEAREAARAALTGGGGEEAQQQAATQRLDRLIGYAAWWQGKGREGGHSSSRLQRRLRRLYKADGSGWGQGQAQAEAEVAGAVQVLQEWDLS
jgi:hypothetical protein